MENMERGVDPTEALIAMQQLASSEVSRFYLEISMRDAYIKQLQQENRSLQELLEKQSIYEEQKQDIGSVDNSPVNYDHQDPVDFSPKKRG